MPRLDKDLMVTLTIGELRALIREELDRDRPVVPEYMSTADVAEMIGCTVESIRTYCTRDGLPCVRIGNIRRYHREDVHRWLEKRRSAKRRSS